MSHRRFLEEGHDHAGEEVRNLKIVIMLLVTAVGFFAFLPYTKCMRKKKEANVDDGEYKNLRFVCCSSGRI